MDSLIMYAGLGVIGYMVYCIVTGKPFFPWLANRKKKKVSRGGKNTTKEIKGDFKQFVGIKAIHGNLIEHMPVNNIRSFVGGVHCFPINYHLRSREEQEATDVAFEEMLASINLGPGREVKFGIHIQSRPIELVDQLRQYRENFPNLEPVPQRYAQALFFPFLEQWQDTVSDFDYHRYIFFILEYPPKLLEGLDEQMIISKAKNEFVRLSETVSSKYAAMGGVAQICEIENHLEALYFATHKRTGAIEHFRQLINREGRLSNIVTSDYSRPPFRYVEEEQTHHVE